MGNTISCQFVFEPGEYDDEFPQHLVAKREVKRWYKSYQILITEVVTSYGDGNLVYP